MLAGAGADGRASMPTVRQALRGSGVVALSGLVGLAAAEGVLRLAGVKFDASLYGEDAVTGWRLRPNAHGWWVSEGNSYVRINSAGMHDREYQLSKPPGTVRIAVLGDSMTAAVQVAARETFAGVLEQELRSCRAFGGAVVEVMNFGVPGFGTAQQLLQYRHQVSRYAPDMVLLAFFTYNDVHNNHRALNPVNPARAPYFVLDGADLVLDDSFLAHRSTYGQLRDRFGDLVNRSRVAQLVAEGLVRGLLFRTARRQEAETQERHGGDMGDLMLAPPRTPEMQEAWRVTEAIVRRLRTEVEEAGSRFWLVTLPVGLHLLPEAERDRRIANRQIEDLYYPNRRLDELARREGFHAVNLPARIAEMGEMPTDRLTYAAQGHYTPAGHRLVGTMIAREICGRR